MPVETSWIDVETADGRMPAFAALPEGPGPHAVVVVLMEAFGLVPHVEDVARRLAHEGHLAVAPNLYYREAPDDKVGYDELPRAIALMRRLDDDAFLADLRALIAHLAERPDADTGRLGMVGFCMGGRLTFLAACALGDAVSAAAPFYGGGTGALLGRADGITAPLLLFFGGKDAFVPLDEVRAIDARLTELGKQHELRSYDDAVHGFFCEQRTESYDAAAAADAWQRLRAFLAEHLAEHLA